MRTCYYFDTRLQQGETCIFLFVGGKHLQNVLVPWKITCTTFLIKYKCDAAFYPFKIFTKQRKEYETTTKGKVFFSETENILQRNNNKNEWKTFFTWLNFLQLNLNVILSFFLSSLLFCSVQAIVTSCNFQLRPSKLVKSL